jgi:hypothetical protein
LNNSISNKNKAFKTHPEPFGFSQSVNTARYLPQPSLPNSNTSPRKNALVQCKTYLLLDASKHAFQKTTNNVRKDSLAYTKLKTIYLFLFFSIPFDIVLTLYIIVPFLIPLYFPVLKEINFSYIETLYRAPKEALLTIQSIVILLDKLTILCVLIGTLGIFTRGFFRLLLFVHRIRSGDIFQFSRKPSSLFLRKKTLLFLFFIAGLLFTFFEIGLKLLPFLHHAGAQKFLLVLFFLLLPIMKRYLFPQIFTGVYRFLKDGYRKILKICKKMGSSLLKNSTSEQKEIKQKNSLLYKKHCKSNEQDEILKPRRKILPVTGFKNKIKELQDSFLIKDYVSNVEAFASIPDRVRQFLLIAIVASRFVSLLGTVQVILLQHQIFLCVPYAVISFLLLLELEPESKLSSLGCLFCRKNPFFDKKPLSQTIRINSAVTLTTATKLERRYQQERALTEQSNLLPERRCLLLQQKQP